MNDDQADLRTVFADILSGDDGGLGPDMDVILTGGRRRRLRRIVTVTGGCATVAAVTIGLGTVQPSGAGFSPSGRTAPVLAGQATTPALPPHDLSQRNEATVHARLLAALRKHLPAGTSLSDGSGPTSFELTHPNGTVTTLGAEEGLQTLAGLPNPCSTSRYASACVRTILPDGSRGWASVFDDGRGPGGQVEVVAVTVDGQVFGLADGNGVSVPGGHQLPDGSGTPLTEQQLIALIEQPDVLAALKSVPTDEPVRATPGVAHTT